MPSRDRSRYRFHARWTVDAPPARVYALLEHGEDYPRWWPQVREVVRTGPETACCRFRSLLPYDLRVTVRDGRRDPASGILEAALTGDLHGWARWTVLPRGPGTEVRYVQDTRLCRPLLRRLTPLLRPAYVANHALMMRAARRGLQAEVTARLDGG